MQREFGLRLPLLPAGSQYPAFFDEPSGLRDVLEMLNQRVASLFGVPRKDVKFVFVPLISRRQVLRGQEVVTVEEALVTCNHMTGVISIVLPRPGWRETVIHELVHLYHPKARESRVVGLTKETIAYLKVQGPIPGANGPDRSKLAAWVEASTGGQ